jgi:arylsulfatase A-like enzyme
VSALLGCSGDSALPPLPERPNIVLYVIDTLRADRLGVYGYDEHTSPNIDALAGSGVVFTNASAPAPWTLPSVTSMFLSQLSCEHGVRVDGDRISEDTKPLALVLKELGYETASFHANPYAGKMSGLDKGFDVARLVKQDALEGVVREWLDARQGGPFFLYIHTVEPHNPEMAQSRFIEPPESVSSAEKQEVELAYRDYRELTRVDFDAGLPPGTTDNTEQQQRALARLNELSAPIGRLYDAMVREADERVSRIVASFESVGVWQNTLFVLVSDHGEELADHGGWQHDQSLYQELVHVPFIVRFPGNARGGRRVTAPVGLLDVVPSLAEILGLQAPADARGRSLVPLIDGELLPHEPRVSSMRHNVKKFYEPYKEGRGDVNVMIRRGPWKGIWNAELDTVELFRLDTDPAEQTDLGQAERVIADAMRTISRSMLAGCAPGAPVQGGPEVELDDESRRQLESLGYVNRRKSP